MEAIVGKIVAFVVAVDENRPEDGCEFADAQFAQDSFESKDGGWYFKKLQLLSGGIEYDRGFHAEEKLGGEMYGLRCASCGKRTWWHKRYEGNTTNYCDECSEKTARAVESSHEPYDGNQERED